MSGTIVMIHGMWCGGWYWKNFETYFTEKGFRCETPDLLYHDVAPGAPPPEKLGNTSLLDYADDLEKRIESLELDEKPILMGHSMGGLLALILASRGVGKAAVLITPAAPAGVWAVNTSVIRNFAGQILDFSWLRGKPTRLSFNTAVYSMLHLLEPEQQKEIYAKSVSESGKVLRELGLWAIDFNNRASWVPPENVKCPLLVIGGKQDRITPAKVVKKTAGKYIHAAQYKEYADHAHSIPHEPGWEKVAEDIHSWIKHNFKQII